MEITKTNEPDSNELNEFQLKVLADAEEALEKMEKEHASKKYLIDIKKNEIEKLSSYILNDAPWKFTECLGIKEVEKDLKECIKTGKLFLSGIAVEAIYYYLSKVDGAGIKTNTSSFENIDQYLSVLKPITGGIERIKADTEKMENARFVVAARREGIEPDSSLITT